VGFVDLTKALLVDAGYVRWVGDDTTVETKGRVGRGIRESTAGWRRLGKDCNWVAEGSGGAVEGRAGKEGRS
jgi:hypothetical protein